MCNCDLEAAGAVESNLKGVITPLSDALKRQGPRCTLERDSAEGLRTLG